MTEQLTLKHFAKHVERYGAEGVMDTARDHLGLAELIVLQQQIDELTPRVKHRKTAERRVRDWLGLTEESQ